MCNVSSTQSKVGRNLGEGKSTIRFRTRHSHFGKDWLSLPLMLMLGKIFVDNSDTNCGHVSRRLCDPISFTMSGSLHGT